MIKNKKTSKIYRKRPFIIGLVFLLVVAGLVGTYAVMNINKAPSLQVEQQANITIPTSSNNVNDTVSPKTLPSGEFKDGDAVHSGMGRVQVVDTPEGPILVFGENFKVTVGPDLLVYLSPNMANEPIGEFASLGKLKSNSGQQAYNLPNNYSEYKTVIIWCRAFGVTFATAEIK